MKTFLRLIAMALVCMPLNALAEVFASFPMDGDPGWSLEGQWEFGQPLGAGSYQQDPVSGFTGTNVYGYNLAGDYANNSPQHWLTTTAIDCSGYEDVQLEFQRWLGVESANYDQAEIEVSNDGSTWVTVWSHSGSAIDESSWQLLSYDISAVADRRSTVFVRWGMGATDGSQTHPGWNIDDVVFMGTPKPPRQTIYSFPMDTDPGWSTDGDWAFGQPQGIDGDPSSGFTGTNVYGYNLAGSYSNSITVGQWLETPALDCSAYTNVTLRFRRWLGVESAAYDGAYIYTYTSQANKMHAWLHEGSTINDGEWKEVSYDISAVADGESAVRISWSIGPTDGSVSFCGWNIDDVIIEGDPIGGTHEILTSQESYNNGANFGESAPDDILEIWNGGSSNMAYTVTTDVPWLSVVPGSGSSTGEVDVLTVDYDTAIIQQAGPHSAQITITAPGAVNSPKVIPVDIYLEGPILQISGSSLAAETALGTSPPDQSFTVYNTGSGTMPYSVSTDVSWLYASPSSGSLEEYGEEAINLSFSSELLPAGSHTGTVTVSSFHAGGSPKTVQVVLNVLGDETHYVDVNNSSPVAPYTTWATAATNIQDAVNYASDGDLVLVTNGTYLLSSAITVSNTITVASVNGSTVTIVDGGSTTRCFNLGSSLCTIDGFTIQNGSTGEYGGGIRCDSTNPIIRECVVQNNNALLRGGGIYYGTVLDSVIQDNTVAYDANDEPSLGGGLCFSTAENCIVRYNSVFDDVAAGGAAGIAIGGGVYEGTLQNCLILFNHCEASGGLASADASAFGGGVGNGIAINCTIYGNNVEAFSTGGTETSVGGGAWNVVVHNSIVWGNLSVSDMNLSGGFLINSCAPDAAHGIDGNITNYPDFYDLGSDDFSLAVSSPCIDSGSNALNSTSFDLAGNPRVVGGTIDMGAYEYMNPNQILVSQNFYNGQSDVGISVPDDSLDIWNGGSSSMAYNITTDVPWLSITPASGVSSGEVDTVTLDYSTAALSAGSHYGEITITSPDAENSPKVIPVDIYIQGAYLELSENSLATGVEQGFSPDSLTFDVYNSGIGGMGYSVSTDVSWLSPSPDSGNLVDSFDSDTITLSFDSATLLAGSHTGTVTVSSFHAEGSPKYVEVVLNVAPPPSDPDSDGDGLPDAWEIQYFGSTNHPDANPDADPDADGPGYGGPGRNWAEWIMGTDPTNANSILKLAQPWEIPGEGYAIDWPTVSGRVYTVEWTDNLTNSFQTLETGITHPQNSYTDTVHTAEDGGFYNLKVELEN